ncbi:MAG TPA: Holliday junction branch migration protein RuvA [Clostridiaceae bacterium]|nr:Holliday junction branch migration protein RuvA [Clostridiaceae bacterium]
MYDYIRGVYMGINKDYVVVEAQGIGFKVFTSGNTMAMMPEKAKEVILYTTQIVREDFLGLYGFSTREELELFHVIITINGVGPKAALSLLSVSMPDRLKMAILNGNESLLLKAPGIGKKIAQRIILELKDKLHVDNTDNLDDDRKEELEAENNMNEALAALISLGYTEKEAKGALKKLEGTLPLEDTIKESLKLLMR